MAPLRIRYNKSCVALLLFLLRCTPVGELALSRGQLGLASDCLSKAQDLSGLLLMAAAKGDRQGLTKLTESALAAGKHNVAFLCLFLLGQVRGACGWC